ncbi:MAG: hypothetical protein AAB767_01675, partial [Patescibacteria group bacterium]
MKLFFINWSGKDTGMIDVVRMLKRKHDIAYMTCLHIASEVDAREFPGTILHEHEDALLGIPPKGFPRNIPPADSGLLRKLSETEVLTLTMMNKHFERKTVSERVFLYHTYVAYWDMILQEHHPDVIIFPTIPHSVYDFVIYALAVHCGIRTVMMEPTWIGDRMIIMNDYITGPDFLRKEKAPLPESSREKLAPDIQNEYERHMRKGFDATPVFVKNIKRNYSGVRLLYKKCRSFFSAVLVRRDFSTLLRVFMLPFRMLEPNLKKEYENVTLLP